MRKKSLMDLLDNLLDDIDDDDDEILAYLNRPRELRYLGERTNLFETLPDNIFFRRFRLTKQTVRLLLEEIQQHLEFSTNKNNAVTPMNQLLCTLRYYATGSQLITCGNVIGVEEPTACRIVHRVTHAIASLYKKYIKYPKTLQEQESLASEFYKIAKFPRVNGAIDCTHVRLISPSGNNAELYRNRKGYYSINVQCVATPDLSFIDVVARWYGSAHASNIWDNCALKRVFMQGKFNNKLLLGDSGYAQTDFIMIPLPEDSVHSRAEALYQESHTKTHNVVEHSFEVWKRRFPILSRGISVNLHRIPGIIVATAVLHNIAIRQNEDVPPVDPEYPMLEDIADLPRSSVHQHKIVQNIERMKLINEYFATL